MNAIHRLLLCGAAVVGLAGLPLPSRAAEPPPKVPRFSAEHTDRSVAPGTDFFRNAAEPATGLRNLNELLEPIRAANKLPALAAAVVRSNQIIALGAVGVRKAGVTEPVTLADHWHHGSITKSMTATLAAMLVAEGKLSWTTKVVDVFPELAATMHAAWKEVTLEQLLSHRSGAPGDLNPSGIWSRLWDHPGTPREQRRFLLEQVTALPPVAPPGTKYLYANAGYAIAGAMLEHRAGIPWEDLMTARLFRPLGMASAGFGVPATPRYINQPWGHTFQSGVAKPVEPGKDADNPPGIGPAGTVHCSLPDLAQYAAFHVAGDRGQGRLLETAVFQKLHADVAGQGYALGWGVTERAWAGGKALQHSGSNNQWYSNVWLAPNKDAAFVALTNVGGDPAAKATDQTIAKLIGEFLER